MLGNQHGPTGAVVRDALHDESCAGNRNVEKGGVDTADEGRSDGLRRTSDIDGEQFVEAGSFDIGFREFGSEGFPTPHGDASERNTIGEVQPSGLEHSGAEQRSNVGRGIHELEVDDPTLGSSTRISQLTLDGGQAGEGLREPLRRREPSEALSGVDEPLTSEQFEGLTDRDSARVVRRSQLGLGREVPCGDEITDREAGT